LLKDSEPIKPSDWAINPNLKGEGVIRFIVPQKRQPRKNLAAQEMDEIDALIEKQIQAKNKF